MQASERVDLFYKLGRLGSDQRTFTDIDLIAHSKQRSQIRKFLEKTLGYKTDQYAVLMHGNQRMIFHHPEGRYSIDVFYDRLQYSHEIHLGSNPKDSRLSLDPVTISPTDLILEKLQIHEINEKDIKDIITLLAACELSQEEGRGKINHVYVARLLANDWGFWHDAWTNLDKVTHFAQKYREEGKLDQQLLGRVLSGISELFRKIDEMPKTKEWQKRSKDGANKKWWNEVEERSR